MQTRERLGLGKVGLAAGPTVEQQFDALSSFSGFVLALLGGMTYNGEGDSECYQTAESFIIALDTSTDVLKKIYIPAYLPELQVIIQDFVFIAAYTYTACSIDKLFNQLVHLASQEGITELSGRVAGAYLFEIAAAQEVRSNPDDYTTQEKGDTYGKAIAVTLNFYI